MANTELLQEILKEVKELRRIVDTKNSYTKTNSTTKEYKTYPKDIELLNRILSVNENEKTDSFIKSILNNSYPSVTEGQKAVIDKIQGDLNL